MQLAAGAHGILLHTESALGSVGLSSSFEKVEVRGKVGQPGDMREGLQQVLSPHACAACLSHVLPLYID